MAKITDVNNTPGTGAEAIFILKELLKSVGWTVPRSSDGTTYNAAGDQISHSGAGANGMANNHAWFVIREPGGGHYWCFQRGTTNVNWRIKISSYADFSTGAPDATHTAASVDQYVIHGTGTDAAPTYAAIFNADGGYRWHVIAENAPVGVASPIYGFWAFATVSGTGVRKTVIIQEPMMIGTFPELSSGTRAAPVIGDPDPVIFLCSYEANILTFTSTSYGFFASPANTRWSGWYKFHYADQAQVKFHGFRPKASEAWNSVLAPGGMVANVYNGADDGLPILIARPADFVTSIGLKGITNNMRMRCLTGRAYPSTINLGSDARVYLDDVILPWADGVVPTV